MTSLKIESLTLSIADKLLCRDLNLKISANECWGLLGRNGVGKTSLIHSIIGIRTIDSGKVLLDSQNISELSRREVAKKIGVLFQDSIETLSATVLETIMLGRHPHVQSRIKDNLDDYALVDSVISELSLSELSDRQLSSLSGGEKQRVAIATLLAQTPNIFLLDEPSNHLDIAFQISVLDTIKSKLYERPASILMATHDINLAARFCDYFVLLLENGGHLQGSKKEVLTAENLSKAYGCKIQSIQTKENTLYYPV